MIMYKIHLLLRNADLADFFEEYCVSGFMLIFRILNKANAAQSGCRHSLAQGRSLAVFKKKVHRLSNPMDLKI